ncbi:MAG: hypothetical protein VKS61_13365 [Candidatus Sericytochromatia bacterium]|nr:hypothetical protein [Candidatus Sericytochromatia bacterium]
MQRPPRRRPRPASRLAALAGAAKGHGDGAGAAAKVDKPRDPVQLALKPDGGLYVAGYGNHLLRVVP